MLEDVAPLTARGSAVRRGMSSAKAVGKLTAKAMIHDEIARIRVTTVSNSIYPSTLAGNRIILP